jgi:ABC-type multidrug transport system ATPase subunit
MADKPALEVEDLELAPGRAPILSGVSFAAAAGELLVVRGESGSGKSSLLLALVGALRPRRGRIRIAGMPLDAAHAPAIRRRMFYMPQEVRAFERETGREFVARALELSVNRGLRRAPVCTPDLCAALGLDETLLDAPLASLSGGERQRLGLLRGLVLEREILLLDEVTSAVDERNRDAIVDLLLGLAGTTVLAVTHDPRFAEQADRVLAIEAGRLVEAAPGVGEG